mgnify:FL=1|jgi:Asp-tRNAAsn/Glu-tRNAGln amidotransferase A subunit and related amidases
MSIQELGRALRSGKLTSVEVLDRAHACYDRLESRLNVYKTWNGDAARKQAQAADLLLQSHVDLGPLMGLPISVKDLFGVPGMPVFAGSDTALPRSYSAAGPVVRSVLQQVGVITGKTHTVEFAFGGLGVNAHWGTPVNPWSTDGHRVPGGSSSGAGLSLLQGTAVLALGTDTAGSVRVPASFTGQAGLKTTVGRWSCENIIPLSSSLDTPGLLARHVQDLALAFSAIEAGMGRSVGTAVPTADLSDIRIGVPSNFFWGDIDTSVAQVVESTLTKLGATAKSVQRMELPGCDTAFEVFRAGGLSAPELSQYMQLNFPEKIARLDPVVQLRVEGAQQVSSVEYLRRKAVLQRCGTDALMVFRDVDVLATPTVAIPPPLMSELESVEAYGRLNMLALRNTVIANLFGWCALTLPVGLDARGLPVGLQLIAPPHAEEKLLAMGMAFEQCLGQGPDLLGRAPGLA